MITEVKLKNWRSHSNSEFEFSEGTNGIIGVMGAGKSSILSGLTFALFGTFPDLRQRKITLDDIIMKRPDKKNKAEVEASFTINGEEYTAFRRIERKNGTTKATLNKNGKKIAGPKPSRVTEYVENILDVDYELFTRAIYSEQNELDFFLKIPKGKRKRKIDNLLGIDRLEKVRKGIVKIINKSKDRKNLRKEDLERIKERVDFEQIDELKKELKKAKSLKEKREKELEDCQKDLEKIEQDLQKLKEISEKHKTLQEKKISLESKLSQITSKIKGKEEYLEYDSESVKEDLERTKKKIDEIKEVSSKISFLKKEIEKLKPKIESLPSPSELKENLERLKEREEEFYKKKESTKTLIKTIKEQIDNLKDVEGKCPVCESDLPESKKEDLLKKNKKSLKKLEKDLEEFVSSFKEVRKQKKEKEQELKKSERVKEAKEDLKSRKQEYEKQEESKNDLESELKELTEKYGVKIEELEDTLRNILDLLLESEQLKDLEKQLQKTKQMISELDFDPEKVKEKEQKRNGLKTKKQLLKEKISSADQMFEEKEKRLKELQERKQELKHFKREVEYLEKALEDLRKFREAVSKSQNTLRERFIQTINDTMNGFWRSIYPYQDFSGIRVAVVDDDYVLQLKERDGNWVNVEGMASGGERTASCLVLRIALASVLTPNLSWLILDEPTHNLDMNAIRELAEMLSDRIDELVDQTFLITHRTELEDAITGKAYRLERDKVQGGVTEVKSLT